MLVKVKIACEIILIVVEVTDELGWIEHRWSFKTLAGPNHKY